VGRYEHAGVLFIVAMSLIALTGAVFYTGMGLPFGCSVLVLILLVAILLLPARWATWAMLAGVGVSIACGLIDLLSPPVQMEVSSFGNIFLWRRGCSRLSAKRGHALAVSFVDPGQQTSGCLLACDRIVGRHCGFCIGASLDPLIDC